MPRNLCPPPASHGHVECEHPVRLDPGIQGSGVEERLPLRAVAGHVDLQQRLAETRVLAAPDVQRDGSTVNGDGELFAREVCGADLRALSDVTEAHRVR